jgi:hypothetical protein
MQIKTKKPNNDSKHIADLKIEGPHVKEAAWAYAAKISLQLTTNKEMKASVLHHQASKFCQKNELGNRFFPEPPDENSAHLTL